MCKFLTEDPMGRDRRLTLLLFYVLFSRYVMGTETNDLEKSKLTYRSLIVELPNGGAEVLRVFQEIESRMQEVCNCEH